MQGKKYYQDRLFSTVNLAAMIPTNHVLVRLDRALDLSFIYELTKGLYCADNGRPSIDPVLFFRMQLIGYLFGIDSDRQPCEEVHLNIAYRWFCRLNLEDEVPDHSSLTRIRDRFGVETYCQGGKIKQRVVQTPGRKDQLIPHLDTLIKLLAPERSDERQTMDELTVRSALSWGPVVVTRHLWDQLDLGLIVRRCCPSRNGHELADRAFVLTASRLCSPRSEHGLAWWLEESYVADSFGRRYLPAWKKSGRVQVDSRQLGRWYRTLDSLIAGKDQIEREVYLRLRALFSLKVELVFYDLTSTYFEGHGPEPLACHGYSRDEQPRDRQVQVGIVMAGGWPIAHHILDGRINDHRTVAQVVGDLRSRFDIGRIVFVGDRGMVSRETIGWLKKEKVSYIVGRLVPR